MRMFKDVSLKGDRRERSEDGCTHFRIRPKNVEFGCFKRLDGKEIFQGRPAKYGG